MSNATTCPRCSALLESPAASCTRCLLAAALHTPTVKLSPGFLDDLPMPRESVLIAGKYEILDTLARGGMGVVYRARSLDLKRTVALKMIRGGRLATPDELLRFQTEAEAAANLDHPNIVPIYEVGEHDGEPFFAMRLVEGASLAQRIAAGEFRVTHGNARAMQTRITELMVKVARAVHHAHQRGVLHRDLKPSNVLVDPAGEPHLTDFGLAKLVEGGGSLTGTADVLGTPEYMAPEQAVGKAGQVTTAADVYSLGTILYELLTGRAPFHADTLLQTLDLVVHHDPAAPYTLNSALDPDLETICLKCLEKIPGRRYQASAELADDLDRFIKGHSIQARISGPWERTVRWYRRKPLVAALTTSLVFLFCIAFTLVFWLWQNAESARRQVVKAENSDLALRQELEAKRQEAIEAGLAAHQAEFEARTWKVEEESARQLAEDRYQALVKVRHELDQAMATAAKAGEEARQLRARLDQVESELSAGPLRVEGRLISAGEWRASLRLRFAEAESSSARGEFNRAVTVTEAAIAGARLHQATIKEARARKELAAAQEQARSLETATNRLETQAFRVRGLTDDAKGILDLDPFAPGRKVQRK